MTDSHHLEYKYIEKEVLDLVVGDLVIIRHTPKTMNISTSSVTYVGQQAVITGFRVAIDPDYMIDELLNDEVKGLVNKGRVQRFETFREAHEAVKQYYKTWVTPDRVIVSAYISSGAVVSLFATEIVPVVKKM